MAIATISARSISVPESSKAIYTPMTAVAAAPTPAPAPLPDRDTLSVSRPAELLSKLQTLRQKDPEQFGKVMSTIADRLGASVEPTTDPRDKQAIRELSSSFRSAASSGDLKAVASHAPGSTGNIYRASRPAPVPKSRAGPRPARKDSADANGDGKISAQERKAYLAAYGVSTTSSGASPTEAMSQEVLLKVSWVIDDALGEPPD